MKEDKSPCLPLHNHRDTNTKKELNSDKDTDTELNTDAANSIGVTEKITLSASPYSSRYGAGRKVPRVTFLQIQISNLDYIAF